LLKSPVVVARLVSQFNTQKPDFVLGIYPIEDVLFAACIAC